MIKIKICDKVNNAIQASMDHPILTLFLDWFTFDDGFVYFDESKITDTIALDKLISQGFAERV